MDLLELIKAYELLKSHGIDLLTTGSTKNVIQYQKVSMQWEVGCNKESLLNANSLHAEEAPRGDRDLRMPNLKQGLVGNTLSQLNFLRQLLINGGNQEGTSLNKKYGEIHTQPKEGEGCTVDNLIRVTNKFVSKGNNRTVRQEDPETGGENNNKKVTYSHRKASDYFLSLLHNRSAEEEKEDNKRVIDKIKQPGCNE